MEKKEARRSLGRGPGGNHALTQDVQSALPQPFKSFRSSVRDRRTGENRRNYAIGEKEKEKKIKNITEKNDRREGEGKKKRRNKWSSYHR